MDFSRQDNCKPAAAALDPFAAAPDGRLLRGVDEVAGSYAKRKRNQHCDMLF